MLQRMFFGQSKHFPRFVPTWCFRADVMVGFPTETDEDFELTRCALHELKIAYPHVFTYSERSGTPAARIPKQVPIAIRKERARLLRQEGENIRHEVLGRYIGERVTTLIESAVEASSPLIRSRMANFVPVYFEQSERSGEDYQSLEIKGFCRDGLLGESYATESE